MLSICVIRLDETVTIKYKYLQEYLIWMCSIDEMYIYLVCISNIQQTLVYLPFVHCFQKDAVLFMQRTQNIFFCFPFKLNSLVQAPFKTCFIINCSVLSFLSLIAYLQIHNSSFSTGNTDFTVKI